MNKIFIFFISVTYILLSFCYIKYYGIEEVNDYMYGYNYSINVFGWEKDTSITEKVASLTEIAESNKINIYKIYFIFIINSINNIFIKTLKFFNLII